MPPKIFVKKPIVYFTSNSVTKLNANLIKRY